jgi:hypothetical protein
MKIYNLLLYADVSVGRTDGRKRVLYRLYFSTITYHTFVLAPTMFLLNEHVRCKNSIEDLADLRTTLALYFSFRRTVRAGAA